MTFSEITISEDKKFRIMEINFTTGVKFTNFLSFEGYFILTLNM